MRLTLSIPGDVRAAEAARRAVSCFEPRLASDAFDTLCLLVNELVTNSLLHACSGGESIGLDVELADGGSLQVSVSDPGTGFRVPQQPPELDATSGRGLFLVNTLADSWGIEADPRTRVWFEMGSAE